MKKILSLMLTVMMFSYCAINGVSAKSENPDIELYAFTYQDVLIEAVCGDGGGSATATRGTVKTNARMASIEYYLDTQGSPLTGYRVRSRVIDADGIGYIFAIEGYTNGYTVTEYNPSYCRW